MIKRGWTILTCILWVVVLQAQQNADRLHPIREDAFVVKWKKSTDPQIQNQHLAARFGDSTCHSLRPEVQQARRAPSVLDGIFIVSVNVGTDIWSVVDSLKETGLVEYVEPIFREEMLLTPNDPGAQPGGDQYYLSNIRAYEAWENYTGNSAIRVGIIDSGSDLDHEDLVGKYAFNPLELENGEDSDGNGYVDDVLGYDFANDDNDPTADNDTHGTRVAGIVGAATNNQLGIAGVGYNTRIIPLKIFSSINNQSGGSYESIQYAADNDYDVINLSWGSMGSYSQFNQDIINYAVLEKDVLIVAAAGNTDEDLLFYPAAYDNVLSVAALDPNDEKAFFATYNNTIDVAAPGVSMYSTINGSGYGVDNGSSYAAPLVAGVGALIRGKYPQLNALEVAERIKATTDPIYDLPGNQPYIGKLGTGRLNAFRALTQETFTRLKVTLDSLQQRNEALFFDDTVQLFVTVENQQDPVFLLNATLGSTSPYVSLIDSTQSIGYMGTGEKTSIGPFRFKLLKNTPSATALSVYLKLEDEGRHKSYHPFDFETAPGYQTLKNDSLAMTVVEDGNLGYQPNGFFRGEGFRFLSNQSQHMGYYLYFNDSVLYDNLPEVISTGQVGNRFIAKETVKPFSNENAATFFFTAFEDTLSNLLIESYTVLWDSLPGSALGIQYRFSNQTSDTLTNLSTGLFFDFNSTASGFSSGLVFADSVAMTSDTASVYQGLHIAADSSFYSVIDMNTFGDSLSVEAKQQLLITRQDSIGFDSRTNTAVLGGAYFEKIPPRASRDFKVVLGGGNSSDQLLEQLSQGLNRLEKFEQTPVIDSLLFACVGGAYDLVPEAGYDFYFFSDPLGADTIAFNDSLRLEQIVSDSVIYLSKVNSSGVSETIKAFEIELFDDIADFKFASDTFFLRDHPNNRIQITDFSKDPISWTWDFGGGNLATGIQHPSPVFSDTGRYDITLTIENRQGCNDQVTKTLTVLQRPSPPDLSVIGFCPNESVHIASVDTLLIYPFATSQRALFSGNSFELGPLNQDTTLYISRIWNGLESRKKEVLIKENPTELTLEISPNIDSLSGIWANFFFSESYVKHVQWNLDTLQSEANPVILPVSSDSLNLSYQIETDSGCFISDSSIIQLTASPRPAITSFDICLGEDLLLDPANGNLFGYYADSSLLQPVFKGAALRIDSLLTDTTLFIVGLDSILPGDLVRVDVSPVDYQFEIITDRDSLYLNLNRSIAFEVSAASEQVIWYVDSVRQAVTLSPTLFFTAPGTYEIVAEGLHAAGCTFLDTKTIYVFETFIEPLSTEDGGNLLFPTPAEEFLYINRPMDIRAIRAFDMTGKQHTVSFDSKKIDITQLPEGIFFLQIELRSGAIETFEGIRSGTH